MMRRILLVAGISLVSAFSRANWESNRPHTALHANRGGTNGESLEAISNRRTFLATSMATATIASLSQTAIAEDGEGPMTDSEGVTVYKTTSGLKYIQLEPAPESSAKKTPRYGQLCMISYKAYLKLPNSKSKDQFDAGTGYIIKHGNGRMISGLDEGLHTMKAGELRRIIIPPKLGFVQQGLGPLPQYPWDRFKLNNLLEKMVTQRGGNLVYDVRLEDFFDDEADQGYYEDLELSPEDLEELQNRLIRGGGAPIG
jgi:FKBP-type peptidyl-prolyl cis-trans isomerase